jgi:hypothetical protein
LLPVLNLVFVVYLCAAKKPQDVKSKLPMQRLKKKISDKQSKKVNIEDL